MNNLESLISKRFSRRQLLKFSGKASAFFAIGSILPNEFLNRVAISNSQIKSGNIFFDPIEPSDADELVLPKGFSYKIIRKWGDKISDTASFGFNNDYIAYLPIDMLSGGHSSEDGLLFINHEYPSPLFINGYTEDDFRSGKKKSAEEIKREKRSVGFSIFRIKKDRGEWQFIDDAKFNRRVDAMSEIRFSGAAAGSPELRGKFVSAGTLANCSGGVTPWGTVLSAEENYQDYYTSRNLWEYRWNDSEEEFNINEFGWVVEVDPFDRNSVPVKRTSLGRFRHENVAVAISKNGRAVAYMGDDKINECVYKFVSRDMVDLNDRSKNFGLLDSGDLYVADFEKGIWQLLDIAVRDELRNEFSSQAEVLVNCDRAAKLVGGTECNRPEDIEISPVDGSLFVSLTNNSKKNDYFGSIVRIAEDGSDYESTVFEWEVFATGGVASGFSCPDNLNFDNQGNLWVLCDVSEKKLNKAEQRTFKNNSLFMIPTQGENRGKAFRFAAGPVDSEMCGCCFTPDGRTMFLSVQHPGENTVSLENPTSRWPDGGEDIPRPAVVVISGFDF